MNVAQFVGAYDRSITDPEAPLDHHWRRAGFVSPEQKVYEVQTASTARQPASTAMQPDAMLALARALVDAGRQNLDAVRLRMATPFERALSWAAIGRTAADIYRDWLSHRRAACR